MAQSPIVGVPPNSITCTRQAKISFSKDMHIAKSVVRLNIHKRTKVVLLVTNNNLLSVLKIK